MNIEIANIKKSIMGTTEFDMKAPGHRGFQNFLCYPIGQGQTAEKVKIQSDKRIGYYHPATGKIELGKSRSGGSYNPHLVMDQLNGLIKTFDVPADVNHNLKAAIFVTTSSEAGKAENGIVQSDNSGAINIFDL